MATLTQYGGDTNGGEVARFDAAGYEPVPSPFQTPKHIRVLIKNLKRSGIYHTILNFALALTAAIFT